jgi:hypothetical protein
MLRSALPALLLLAACVPEYEADEGARAVIEVAEGEVVERPASWGMLSWVSVSDGGRYPDGVLLQVRVPEATAYVVYSAGGRVLGVASDRASTFAVTATFGEVGPRTVVARAFDADDAQLAEGAVRLTVEARDERPTVRFLSPETEGGAYTNGVQFKALVTGPVAAVRYTADGYLLGESRDTASAFAVRYTFSRIGERTVRAEALSAAGEVVAEARRTLVVVDPSQPATSGRAGKAAALLLEHRAGRVVFWEQQFGGRVDGADAYANLRDTAEGRGARRSVHGTAPGGTVPLSTAMLDGMLALEGRGFSFFVTSVAGGSHSSGSLHYAGRAFDLDEIDGVRIAGDSARVRALMSACRQLGASEVFGPSNDPAGHFDHVHCAW